LITKKSKPLGSWFLKRGVIYLQALSKPRIRFAEKGYVEDNDVYVAFGQTFSGRYLAIFFVYKPDEKTVIIISARNMTKKERKAYGRK
jgi:uncharacterized DUF497 family protein